VKAAPTTAEPSPENIGPPPRRSHTYTPYVRPAVHNARSIALRPDGMSPVATSSPPWGRGPGPPPSSFETAGATPGVPDVPVPPSFA
jgi:hypothetical protein